MMRKRILTITALAALAAVSTAQADLCFESKTWQEGKNATAAANITVEGCVDGKRFGVTILESGNPFMQQGHRLVSADVADEITLVNDKEETYSPWDIDAILGAATTILKGMGPLLKIKVENATMATVETSKTTFLGRPVERVKIESEYDIVTRVMGIKNQQHVSAVEELWIDHNLDSGFGAWFDRDPPDLGPEFNQLWELEKQKLRGGVALKTVRWETSTGKKGKNVSELKTITEIVKLEKKSAAPATYTWPDHYKLVNMMPSADQLTAGQPAAQDGADETGDDKKGWRKRIPFGKKKDG